MMTDPIASMLTIIRNGQMVKKPSVLIPYSKIKFGLALLLKKEGFVSDVTKGGRKTKKYIEIFLKYNKDGSSFINELKRVSKPSRRVYIKKERIRPVKQNQGIIVISTSSGLLTNKEAQKAGKGGEIICELW